MSGWPQVALDDGPDVGAGKWFRHVVVGSGQNPGIDLDLGRERADQDDWNVCEVGLPTHPPADLDPAQPGQLHGKQSHCRTQVGQHSHSLAPVRHG
jgi:hypothetical protein